MSHGPRPAAGAAPEHGEHAPPADGTRPVQSSVPIRMGKALDDHPIVADILLSRASAISRDPAHEAVVLVAHGPVPDADNALWLEDMNRLAVRVRAAVPFAKVEAITVRDDAPAPVREAATADLRALVTRLSSGGSRVLIVPLLLSYGGIEAGIRKRLEGLDYTMASRESMPTTACCSGCSTPRARRAERGRSGQGSGELDDEMSRRRSCCSADCHCTRIGLWYVPRSTRGTCGSPSRAARKLTRRERRKPPRRHRHHLRDQPLERRLVQPQRFHQRIEHAHDVVLRVVQGLAGDRARVVDHVAAP